ncbi:MAG: N-acetylmuramidase domain-containing protein [Bacteroidota bacterium]
MKKAKMLTRLKKMTGSVRQPVDKKSDVEKPVIMKGKVIANVLNVRSDSSLDSDVIGKLKRNELVEIIGIEDNWFEIQFSESSVFVSAKFIKPIIKSGSVIANILNVRSLPNRESDVIGKLKRDKRVIVVDELEGWYRIKYKETFAYVSAKYIDLKARRKNYLYTNVELQKVALEPEVRVEVNGNRIQQIVRHTYNQYGNLLKALSKQLGVDLASTVAVIGVESGGKGFDDDKVLIRFENHLFYRYWGRENEKVFKDHFRFSYDKKWLGHKFRTDVDGEWGNFHGDQDKEHEVFAFARKLDEELALKSISMGLPQILGSNSKLIGYESIVEMYENFNKDIRFHIFGLFDFLSPRMIKFLRNKEFVNFAKYYNGAGQARRYGKWLQDYYEAFPADIV